MTKDEIRTHFEEIDSHVKDLNRRLLLLCDKQSTANQRRALTQGIAVINKTVKHVKAVMGV